MKKSRKKGIATLYKELNIFMTRPICTVCNKNHCAPNYYRKGVRYWRKKCEDCIRKGRKLLPSEPRWKKLGYQKKITCDLCGFLRQYDSQLVVYHIDGDLNNNQLMNLRTICLNCVETVKRREPIWKLGDLEADI